MRGLTAAGGGQVMRGLTAAGGGGQVMRGLTAAGGGSGEEGPDCSWGGGGVR